MRTFIVIVIVALAAASAARPQQVITLHFEARPPYLVGDGNGGALGLTATPAANAFRAAGITFNWQQSSMNRQLHLLKENAGQHCVIGWFKNAKRSRYVKFTRPIYRDKALVGVVRSTWAGADGRRLDEVLAAPGLRVVVKANYSYGAHVDRLLERAPARPIASSQPNAQIAELVRNDRADLMFVAEEEAEVLLRQNGAGARALRRLAFSDTMPGEWRHIACTRQVPDALIERLDANIALR